MLGLYWFQIVTFFCFLLPQPNLLLLRKGTACHLQILKELLDGMSFEEKDAVMWLDLGPNRSLGLRVLFGPTAVLLYPLSFSWAR